MPRHLTLEINGASWPLQSGDVIGRFGTVALDALKQYDMLSRRHLQVDFDAAHQAWTVTLLPNVRNATRMNGKQLVAEQPAALGAINDLTIHTLHFRLRQNLEVTQFNTRPTLSPHPVALLTVDSLLQIHALNPAAEALLSPPPSPGANLSQWLDTSSTVKLRQALEPLIDQQTATPLPIQTQAPLIRHIQAGIHYQAPFYLLALTELTELQHLQEVRDSPQPGKHHLTDLLASPALQQGDLPAILPLIIQYGTDLLPHAFLTTSLLHADGSLQPAAKAGAAISTDDFPHYIKSHPLGHLHIHQSPAHLWRETDQHSAQLIGQLFALALDNAREQRELQRLQHREDSLKHEFAQATRYLARMLPKPLEKGPVNVQWEYLPSGGLGGDVFGYDWLSDDEFYLFVVDVAGHGVGAALLAVSLVNHLRLSIQRNESWLHDPATWLQHLNQTFPMEQHGGLTWTLWCGIYHPRKRELHYSSGGHPPAILLDRGKVEELTTNGPVLGALEDLTFTSAKVRLHPGAKLFLYTDGVFEFPLADDTTGSSTDFIQTVATTAPMHDGECTFLRHHATALCGSSNFPDDFTLLRARFE